MTTKRIFVSHSHTDASFCQALVLSLRAAGADVWYDEQNLDHGQLMEVVQRELASRPVFIVILTKAAFASIWVKRETTWAYGLADHDSTRILLPVTAAPIDHTDFSGSQGWLFLSDFKRIEALNCQPFPPIEAIQRTLRALDLTLQGETPATVMIQANKVAGDLIARGMALRAQRKHQDALALFQRATQLAPKYSEAWFHLGYTLDDLQQYSQALAAYERALTLEPGDAETWYFKGLTLQNFQQYHDALTAYEQALTLDASDINAWNNKGMILRKLQRYQEALVVYDQVLTINPNDANAWNNRGTIFSDLQHYKEALDAYDHALALDPNDVLAWYNKGLALANLRRDQDALAAYDHALTLDPNYANAWYNKGLALQSLQRYPEAVQNFKRYTMLTSADANANANGWEQLAVCYRQLNYEAEANAADATAASLRY